MVPRPPPLDRSFARWLVRTEPVALLLLLTLSVLLLALTLLGRGHHRLPAGDDPPLVPTTARG